MEKDDLYIVATGISTKASKLIHRKLKNSNRPVHFALFTKGIVQSILDKEKTIESRFSKNKITPYKQVEPGDLVFMRETGYKNPLCAYGIVSEVKYFDFHKLSVNDVKIVYNDKIKASNQFWKSKQTANYATLIYFKEVNPLVDVQLPTKKDRRGWVTLSQ